MKEIQIFNFGYLTLKPSASFLPLLRLFLLLVQQKWASVEQQTLENTFRIVFYSSHILTFVINRARVYKSKFCPDCQ